MDKDDTRNISVKEQQAASNPKKKVCRQIIHSSELEENSVEEDEDVAKVISNGPLTQRIPSQIVCKPLSIPLERGKKMCIIFQCC
jgi:hypothetical protein